MGFQLIVPPPKAGKGVVRISTVQRQGRPFHLQISMPATMFHLQFGDLDQFDILIGEGPDKGRLLITPAIKRDFYQTRQTRSRTIGCPTLQEKAAANSGMFETTPLIRYSFGECGLVIALTRFCSGRSDPHAHCAMPTKNR